MILPGARIGYEEPVTVENCAIGRHVKLQGGYFSDAVFLDRAVLGKGAHVRGGTLLEEEANGAHVVGLKQTILFPFVTLGSLINFCDILMAGGTSRQDHSEVGSSFIHFNFTPFGKNGDKATPSLIGDVPRGVMLRSSRIFLGGQGGLVGPMHIDYGTVLAAGAVYRRDYGPHLLVIGETLPVRQSSFDPSMFSRIRNKVGKNLTYIGNLVALWHWYEQIRLSLAGSDELLKVLYCRARGMVEQGVEERIKRLAQLASYMEDSMVLQEKSGKEKEAAAQRSFAQSWPEMEQWLKGYKKLKVAEGQSFDTLLAELERVRATNGARDYLQVIRALSDSAVEAGSSWLSTIVQRVENTLPAEVA
jgi:UDP-N-acetylglucosamine/UDP-N-acetylgalactosamine diphosphorylase